ncbi:RNA-dependent RNA polymerase 6 [Artemisia annua]|uniref:RNA-dependent RNA polymerase 6 n=1 Tax=Artemisia annua TaxID=35608 RepID=A0A2U1PGW4_ARTAN|nr:RNA-dependent RNA polymerase 6 [Artemisia annua]
MESERNNVLVATQVRISGFGDQVTAKILVDYIEITYGLVWKCKVKTSSTPRDAYPVFDVNLENVQKVTHYEKVEPYAFLQFVSPDTVDTIVEDAHTGQLVYNNNTLKVILGPQIPYEKYQLRMKETPYRLSNVGLEVGLLTSQDNFVVSWRGSDSGVDLLIDPFDCSIKFLFTKDTAFSLKGTKDYIVIKCDFKAEFLLRNVKFVKECDNHLVLVLQLASAPCIFYRTADDDIKQMHPSEMLDDDDPWIRTTNFTPSGAIGRCNTYRVSIRICDVLKVKKALAFLEEQGVEIEHNVTQLKVEDGPSFGSWL